MEFFQEDKLVEVYCWDLISNIYTGKKTYQAEKGCGLPSGMTLDAVKVQEGKVATRDLVKGAWVYVEDDRGRTFYSKADGSTYYTVQLNEVVDRRQFTKIVPPVVTSEQLIRFEDSTQEWSVGYDWYELPVWSSSQVKSFYTESFFMPDEHYTNIEPIKGQENFVLDSQGLWVEPLPEEGVE